MRRRQGGRLESRPTRSEPQASGGGPLHWLVAGLVSAWLAPLGLGADPGHAPPSGSFRFEPPAPGSYELPAIDRVSEHEMLGSDGKPRRLLDLERGEAALVSFVYLSCGEECPLSTATLHHLDRMLAQDASLAARVRLVTVSFDPARDTPERMAALAKGLEPKGRWSFLTSRDAAALAPVLADFGQDAVRIPAADEKVAPDRLRHVLKVFLVDEHRDVRNIYSTGVLDVRLVMNDLRTLLRVSGHAGHH